MPGFRNQVPASIVCDAYFQLSKTWFDSISAIYPDDQNNRPGDRTLPGLTDETSVRAGVIAGNNLSSMSGSPDAGNFSSTSSSNESRLNGGMHNFPRFLENWSDKTLTYNGSMVVMFASRQATGFWVDPGTYYNPPIRKWAFDQNFLDPNKLPPGTPQVRKLQRGQWNVVAANSK